MKSKRHYIMLMMASTVCLFVLVACNSVALSNNGPPAPWSTLIGAAQDQAHKVDEQAVLRYIFVDIPNNPPKTFNYNNPLEIRFDFITPGAQAIVVKLRDTDPPSVLNVDSSGSGGFMPTDEERKLFAQDLATVKLGPREVYQRVVGEGKDYDQAPRISMLFPNDDRYKLWTGKTIVWDVHFDDYLDNYPTETLRLLVDVETGQVLDRQHGPSPVTPTP